MKTKTNSPSGLHYCKAGIGYTLYRDNVPIREFSDMVGLLVYLKAIGVRDCVYRRPEQSPAR